MLSPSPQVFISRETASFNPSSAVHVVSFWHLKTQPLEMEQKITSVCMSDIEAGSIRGYVLWVSIPPTLPQQHIKAVSLIMPGSSTDTA